MNKRLLLWGAPIGIGLLFSLWYTDLGGPLSQREISEAMVVLQSRGLDADRLTDLRSFLENDTGRQFLMVNNIDLNENPPAMPAMTQDATASDYIDYYMEHMYPQLFARACHPVFFASGLGFSADISGIEGARGWDIAALFRYRSRRSFLEIITHPDMGPRHEYKLAAMTKTIAYPVEANLYLSDPRFLIILILGFTTALLDLFFYKPEGR